MEIDSQSFIGKIISGREVVRINILDDEASLIGRLYPVTRSVLADNDLIQKLTNWRNLARRYFFTQFIATCDRTRNWIENTVLQDRSRLLFIIHSKIKPIGQYGFKRLSVESVELDNLMRGEMGGHPRLIYRAEIALIDWIFSVFDVNRIYAFILSDNHIALNLHKSVGFKMSQRIPLSKVEFQGEIHLQKGTPGCQSPDGLYAQKVELERSDFIRRKDLQRER